MNYCGLNFYDTANGPGIRISLFVSGCRLHCKGCFNKESWNFNTGKQFTPSIKNEIVSKLKENYYEGFSLLGGDPMEPEHFNDLLDLLQTIKRECPNKTIWCWTGRKYESLSTPLLQYIDVLIDGPYKEKLADPTLMYRGSSNQRILNIGEYYGSNKD